MIGKSALALFDFDGTITSRDTLFEFIRYTKGWFQFFAGFALMAPILALHVAKVISNKRAKEFVLTFFFKGIPVEKFQTLCDEFSEKRLPTLMRPQAIVTIKRLRDSNVRIIIVSASPQNWISKWASSHGLEVIATQLEVIEGNITGKILGENCHGVEKIRRIKSHLDLLTFKRIYAYGDTPGDKPMLNLATDKFYKPFRS